jgi:transcriptional regulator with XRE-family HTH domain
MAKAARSAKRDGFTYRSYNFVNKDPVIDKVRTIVQDEGLAHSDIAKLSGVGASTLNNWFEGETRKPQYATIAAVVTALGYEAVFKRGKRVDFETEVAKATREIEIAKKKAAKGR